MKFIPMNDVNNINGGKGDTCSVSYDWFYRYTDPKRGWMTTCERTSKCVDKHGKTTSLSVSTVANNRCS